MTYRRLIDDEEERRAIRLAQAQPDSARELDELFARVKARTVEAALQDPRVAARLRGVRYQVVGADLRDEKPPAGKRLARRLAEVGIYDYDRNALVVPVVDLRRGAVVELEERSGFQPPLTPEETEAAKRIALADPQFSRLKRRGKLEIVAMPARASFSDGHQAYGHRVFWLYFWTGGERPRKVGEAIVDLSTQTLLPREAEPGTGTGEPLAPSRLG
jgi:hypothetical protein